MSPRSTPSSICKTNCKQAQFGVEHSEDGRARLLGDSCVVDDLGAIHLRERHFAQLAQLLCRLLQLLQERNDDSSVQAQREGIHLLEEFKQLLLRVVFQVVTKDIGVFQHLPTLQKP